MNVIYSLWDKIIALHSFVFSTLSLFLGLLILVALLYNQSLSSQSPLPSTSDKSASSSSSLSSDKNSSKTKRLSHSNTSAAPLFDSGLAAMDRDEMLFETKVKHLMVPLEELTSAPVKAWIAGQEAYYDELLFGDKSLTPQSLPDVPTGTTSTTKSTTITTTKTAAAATSNSSSSSAAVTPTSTSDKASLPLLSNTPAKTVTNSDTDLKPPLKGAGSDNYAFNMTKVCKSVNHMSFFKIVYPPIQRGKLFFYYKQDHYFIPQPTLYYTKDIKKDGKIVLDVSTLFQIGFVLRGSWVSNDGIKVAYGVSTSVDDLDMTLYVRDIISGVDSNIDVIKNCSATQFSLSWFDEHIGFYYSVRDVVKFHKLASSSSQDIVVFSNERVQKSMSNVDVPGVVDQQLAAAAAKESEDADNTAQSPTSKFDCFSPCVTFDGRYLVIEAYSNCHFADGSPSSSAESSSESSSDDTEKMMETSAVLHQTAINDELGSSPATNGIFLIELPRKSSNLNPTVSSGSGSSFSADNQDNVYVGTIVAALTDTRYSFQYITNDGGRFAFRTNYQSNGFRVVEFDLQKHSVNRQRSKTDPTDLLGLKRNETPIPLPPPKVAELFVEDAVERIKERSDGGVLLRSFVVFESIIVLLYLSNASHEILLYDFASERLDNDTSLAVSSSLPLSPTPGSSSKAAQGTEAPKDIIKEIDQFFSGVVDSLKEATGGGSFSYNNTSTPSSLPPNTSSQSKNLLEMVASLPLPLGVSVTSVHGTAKSKFIFYQYQGLGEMGSVYRVSLFRGRTEKSSKTSLELTLDLICKSSIPGVVSSLYETRLERIPVRKSGGLFSMTPASEQAVQDEPIDGSTNREKSSSMSPAMPGSIKASVDTARLPLTIFGLKANLPVLEQTQSGVNNSTNSSNNSSSSSNNSNSNNSNSHTNSSEKPAPCIILLHGGFGVSLLPSLNLPLLSFVKDFGGIVCIAHIRGGGELGRAWHSSAAGSKRQGGADDLISAIDFLTQAGYTTPSQLAVIGGSVGGLVVAAAVNQRPELFSAVVLEDAMLDVCRHHVYDVPANAGPDYDGNSNLRPTTWTDEIGCITESKDECLRLVKLCPIRNAERAFLKMVASSSQVRSRETALNSLISSLDNDSTDTTQAALTKEEIAARCTGSGTSESGLDARKAGISTSTGSNTPQKGKVNKVVVNQVVPALLVCTGHGSAVSPIHSLKYVLNWQTLLKKYSVDRHCFLRFEGLLKDIDPFDAGQQLVIGDNISKSSAENCKFGIYEARKMSEMIAFIVGNISIDSN